MNRIELGRRRRCVRGAGGALEQALDEEGRADEAVGAADQFLDLDLLPARVDGELEGGGHHHDGGEEDDREGDQGGEPQPLVHRIVNTPVWLAKPLVLNATIFELILIFSDNIQGTIAGSNPKIPIRVANQ